MQRYAICVAARRVLPYRTVKAALVQCNLEDLIFYCNFAIWLVLVTVIQTSLGSFVGSRALTLLGWKVISRIFLSLWLVLAIATRSSQKGSDLVQ